METTETIADRVGDLATGFDWQSALADREAQARELIRSHPVAAVMGAALIGFALARLIRDSE